MRKTFLIAALVSASVTGAHAQGGCRGETISELNDCIAAATPEPIEPVEEETTVTRPAARATPGGALQPRNLRATPPRAAPPLARPPAAERETAVPRLAPDGADAARIPFATGYGATGPAARASRNVPGTPAMGTRIYNDLRDIPGTFDSR